MIRLLVVVLGSLWLIAEASGANGKKVFDLIYQRLSYMEEVARFKASHQLPVEDIERERVVLDEAIEAARQTGLNGMSTEAFFLALIDAAKSIQYRARADWIISDQAATEPTKDLIDEIRPTLLRIGERIIEAIKEHLEEESSFEGSLYSHFGSIVDLKYLSVTHKRMLFKSLQAIKLADQ